MIGRPPRSTLLPCPTLFRSVMATPFGTVNASMKLTEQGETISDKYSLPALAHDNLEILLSATLDATLLHTASRLDPPTLVRLDRKSTRLNSSHANISYAVFC